MYATLKTNPNRLLLDLQLPSNCQRRLYARYLDCASEESHFSFTPVNTFVRTTWLNWIYFEATQYKSCQASITQINLGKKYPLKVLIDRAGCGEEFPRNEHFIRTTPVHLFTSRATTARQTDGCVLRVQESNGKASVSENRSFGLIYLNQTYS